ncbi:hypothetical protein IFM89_024766 [Coptis chinensis]|uniref:Uncharacterized protein n=1 Tax=Coptis chinensis TaxID=261450 RepID=A0A835LCJ3_9MAGN|nr:hypothetical protein IFM89_024766 [Coptis chinensis]
MKDCGVNAESKAQLDRLASLRTKLADLKQFMVKIILMSVLHFMSLDYPGCNLCILDLLPQGKTPRQVCAEPIVILKGGMSSIVNRCA